MLLFLLKQDSEKYKTMSSALAQIILLICPICSFIQFFYFLVDYLVSNYGQQFIFQMDNNLFSSCHNGVTSGKVKGSELCLDMSQPSAAATRQVILGYKCVHEGCQEILSPGKDTAFKGRKTVANSAETSSLGAKSFRAALQMLNAQSFISSPFSTLHIKMRNIVHFAAKPPRERNRILCIFDSIHTNLPRGECVGGNAPLQRAVTV